MGRHAPVTVNLLCHWQCTKMHHFKSENPPRGEVVPSLVSTTNTILLVCADCAVKIVMSHEMSRDKSHSARDIDVQPATIDVSDEDAGKLEKTPSHSLPAVTLAGAGSGRSVQASADGGSGTAHGMEAPAFVDVDDIAMHVDRDPNRWHDTVRVNTVSFSNLLSLIHHFHLNC